MCAQAHKRAQVEEERTAKGFWQGQGEPEEHSLWLPFKCTACHLLPGQVGLKRKHRNESAWEVKHLQLIAGWAAQQSHAAV